MKRTVNATEALQRLVEGNKRYIDGLRSVEAMSSVLLRKQLAEKGQSPFAIILTCSDSRAPAEILFDQGLGELFVVRVAGNVLAPSLLASIEFAAHAFKTQLCVVMGHTYCGAIGAAVDHFRTKQLAPSPSLTELVGRIAPAVEEVAARSDRQTRDWIVQQATHVHVTNTASEIVRQSPILADLEKQGQFRVVEAVYDLETGKVDWRTD